MPASKEGEKDPKTNGSGDGSQDGAETTLTPEQTARVEEIRTELKTREIEFKDEDTLEELEETLKLSDDAIAKANAKAAKEKEKADGKGEKKPKPPEERILDRRTRRLQEKADRDDTIRVYCTHGTNWGPRLTVVDMPRVDAANFGDTVIESKFPVGTRVDIEGAKLKAGQEIDKEGNAYTPDSDEN